MRLRSLAALCAAFLLVFGAADARAQNLVINPGFETGDLTGYTEANSSFSGVTNDPVNSGNFSYLNGTVQTVATLTQTITTTVGEAYTVSFFFNNPSDVGTEQFGVSFGGQNLIPIADPTGTTGFVNFTFTGVVATSTASDLVFSFRDDIDFLYIDDISVIADAPAGGVPEPSAAVVALSITGVLGGLVLRRRISK